MHVFVTGASGWVGYAVIQELVGAGHRVTGLGRSGDKAAAAPTRASIGWTPGGPGLLADLDQAGYYAIGKA